VNALPQPTPTEAAESLVKMIEDAPADGGGPRWDRAHALNLAKALALHIRYLEEDQG
jgi:hypothetical protein